MTDMFLQPIIGHHSDGCTSKYGRRPFFIVVAAIFAVVAILTISFSVDLGFLLRDSLVARLRAIVIFALGFWIFDVANNGLQSPCRALLVDFTRKDQKRT
jgi:solute carrier family 45 protein 1/2/4